jgi:hypothetical protein
MEKQTTKQEPKCERCGRTCRACDPPKVRALEALAQGATVSAAARAAKCSRQYVQSLRR